MTNPESPEPMACEEILRSLNEYIDNEEIRAVCREFAEHLKGCNPCQIVVDNIRHTIRLYKNGEPYDVPPGFAERLREPLRQKWREKFAR